MGGNGNRFISGFMASLVLLRIGGMNPLIYAGIEGYRLFRRKEQGRQDGRAAVNVRERTDCTSFQLGTMQLKASASGLGGWTIVSSIASPPVEMPIIWLRKLSLINSRLPTAHHATFPADVSLLHVCCSQFSLLICQRGHTLLGLSLLVNEAVECLVIFHVPRQFEFPLFLAFLIRSLHVQTASPYSFEASIPAFTACTFLHPSV